jgi:hypothetical protein
MNFRLMLRKNNLYSLAQIDSIAFPFPVMDCQLSLTSSTIQVLLIFPFQFKKFEVSER